MLTIVLWAPMDAALCCQDDPITSKIRRDRDARVFGSDPEPSLAPPGVAEIPAASAARGGTQQEPQEEEVTSPGALDEEEEEGTVVEELVEIEEDDDVEELLDEIEELVGDGAGGSRLRDEAPGGGSSAAEEAAPVAASEGAPSEKSAAAGATIAEEGGLTASADKEPYSPPVEPPVEAELQDTTTEEPDHLEGGEEVVPVYEEKTRSGLTVYRARRMPLQGWGKPSHCGAFPSRAPQ